MSEQRVVPCRPHRNSDCTAMRCKQDLAVCGVEGAVFLRSYAVRRGLISAMRDCFHSCPVARNEPTTLLFVKLLHSHIKLQSAMRCSAVWWEMCSL